MRYNEWVEKGGAVTARIGDPSVKSIIIPVAISTVPDLCKGGKTATVQTSALVDTGASCSAIDKVLAEQLGLISIRKTDVKGVHGSDVVDVFRFSIVFGSINIRLPFVTAGDFGNSPFKFLLGMDVLRLGEMYLGQEEQDGKPKGTIFSFSIPPTGESIDYVDKLNKARRSLAKRNH